MKKVDVVIIGAGPGGVTAAIYLKRAGIDFVLIEKYMIGGKVNLTAEVDNYPPIKNISGADLALSYYEDLRHNKINVVYDEVKLLKQDNEVFYVETKKETYECKYCIVGSGTSNKYLDIPGEKEFINKGISACAVCDGPLFKNQPIAVVGGGNSALEETLYLASITNKVYLIHRRDEFRGSQEYVDAVRKNDNIEILTSYVVKECKGDSKLRSIIIENVNTKELKEIDVEAMFEYVGLIPNASFIDIELDNKAGFINVNSNCESSCENLYAIGDITSRDLRQIVVASSDGAVAANDIINKHNLSK